MNPLITLFAAAVIFGGFAAATPASAAVDTYEYRVEHPTYGDIGTYVNVVRKTGDETEVSTDLRVAVKILGIVVYREEAHRSEHWRNDKLLSFESVTVSNGNKIEVHGEAQGTGFVINAPSGTITAPGNVHPSNPWSAMVLNTNFMMSTKTGMLVSVRVSGGDLQSVAFDGQSMQLHQYDIVSDKHQIVWLDDRGLPVAFRTEQNGSLVDFVLVKHS